jgi:hypothetical protein
MIITNIYPKVEHLQKIIDFITFIDCLRQIARKPHISKGIIPLIAANFKMQGCVCYIFFKKYKNTVIIKIVPIIYKTCFV